MSKTVELRTRIGELAKAQAAVSEQYPDANDIPSEVMEQVKSRHAEIVDLSEQFKTAQENDRLMAESRKVNDEFNKPKDGFRHPGAQDDGENSKGGKSSGLVVAKSIGQRFVEDEEFKGWMSRVAPNGFLSEKIRVTSPQVQMGSLGLKTVVTGGSVTSGGALVFPDVQAGLVQLPTRPLTMRDIVTNAQTSSDTVEFVRVTGYTNNAASVVESTDITPASAGYKPESAMALEKVTTVVSTIAHWIPATKRALSDASQLRGLIDAFLLDGLAQEVEDEMVNGNGAGDDLVGIANTPNTQSQAFTTDILTTLRSARTLVRVVGRDTPTAYLMHPNDWQDIDLLQDNEARYFMGGPRDILTPRLWGLPVVESEAVTEGTAYVGNFKQAVLWDREQSGIQVSDSPLDFFLKNMVAILAEMRVAFTVLRPQSIVEVDLTA